MKQLLTMICILLSFSAHAAEIPAMPKPSLDISLNTEPVSSVMSATELKVRQAAVRVHTVRGGHGSGSLIKYKGLTLVFTANHVADGSLGSIYYVSAGSEIKPTVLVYSDAAHDIAILYAPEEFSLSTPLKYSARKAIVGIGEEITYSGFPSSHQLMTFRGRVAGYEYLDDMGIQILLHTHGWFGCSGSLVYDSYGDIVGILWGIDVEGRYGYGTQVIGSLIWIQPIQALNLEHALKTLCANIDVKVRACK